MRSALYVGEVVHERFQQRAYRFANSIPWWLLDLSELDALERRFVGFRRNAFALFSFRDRDHCHVGLPSAAANAEAIARAQGLTGDVLRVQLLTQLRVLGHVFNPVSFYFLETTTGRWILTEVGNTFWEQKPTLRGPFATSECRFTMDKFFYVSPFLALDNKLELVVRWPGDTLAIAITDRTATGELALTAAYTGARQAFEKDVFVRTFWRFPLVTWQIIAAIHWHALRLWRLGVPYFKKSAHPELQQGVYTWKERSFVKAP